SQHFRNNNDITITIDRDFFQTVDFDNRKIKKEKNEKSAHCAAPIIDLCIFGEELLNSYAQNVYVISFVPIIGQLPDIRRASENDSTSVPFCSIATDNSDRG
ncbi:unnamed protein product, partial [Adineta ricciae]